MTITSERSAPHGRDPRHLEAELLGAALRYVAVADWFESLPSLRKDAERNRRAMDVFNGIEAELRKSGARLLRRLGHRHLVLDAALQEARWS